MEKCTLNYIEDVTRDPHMERLTKRADQIFLNIRMALLPIGIVRIISQDDEKVFNELMAQREDVIDHTFSITNHLLEMAAEGNGKEMTDEELEEMGRCAEGEAINFVNRIMEVQGETEKRMVQRAIKKAKGDEKNEKRLEEALADVKKQKSDNAVRDARATRGNKKARA